MKWQKSVRFTPFYNTSCIILNYDSEKKGLLLSKRELLTKYEVNGGSATDKFV